MIDFQLRALTKKFIRYESGYTEYLVYFEDKEKQIKVLYCRCSLEYEADKVIEEYSKFIVRFLHKAKLDFIDKDGIGWHFDPK